jgi:hypothetical protein
MGEFGLGGRRKALVKDRREMMWIGVGEPYYSRAEVAIIMLLRALV